MTRPKLQLILQYTLYFGAVLLSIGFLFFLVFIVQVAFAQLQNIFALDPLTIVILRITLLLTTLLSILTMPFLLINSLRGKETLEENDITPTHSNSNLRSHTRTQFRTDMRSLIKHYFNKKELSGIYFELGLEHNAQSGKDQLIQELIDYCKRHGRTVELLRHLEHARPHVIWPTMPNDEH